LWGIYNTESMEKSPFDLFHQNQSVDGKLIAALERVSQAFRVLLWNESKEFSLSPIQVQVLIFLLHHTEEKRKVSYLANEFNMTKATISDTIKTLEQKGLISKAYAPHDSRSYTIQLSPKGREIAGQTALFTKELQAPIDRLHPDDKENLLLSLLHIIRHLNQAGIITIQRMCFTCAYYRSGRDGEPHFCRLLNKPLERRDLRVDCPEHTFIG